MGSGCSGVVGPVRESDGLEKLGICPFFLLKESEKLI